MAGLKLRGSELFHKIDGRVPHNNKMAPPIHTLQMIIFQH